MVDNWHQKPVDDPEKAARHRTLIIVLTVVMVAAPLLLGALRLLGII